MKGPRSGGQLSLLLKLGLLIGCSVLVIAVFVFTQQTIHSLSRQIATTSQVLARFCAQASYPATIDPRLSDIVHDVISHIDFPMIITDSEGVPRAWRQVDVDEALVPSESIDSLKLGMPVTPVIRARIEAVRRRVVELDKRNAPIPMTMPGVAIKLGDVHFGDPPVLDRLRWTPWVSMAGVLALLAIGLWGLAILRQVEKRTIWVGMAKETAHQLGTPLSSLMGWTELLRTRAAEAGEVTGPELDEALGEMDRDIDRLRKVAQRFSRVGSAPELIPSDVTPVVQGVVAYMRKRVPQSTGEVEIRENYEPVPRARLSAELLEWALENLLVNAISALDKRPAWVEVSVRPRDDGREIEIRVADNGRGMSAAERRSAFDPGFTTKRRGWGLGLPLARRVVEEYHRGRIAIVQTTPGKGTTMAMTLPADGG